jgi:hypothetical protein
MEGRMPRIRTVSVILAIACAAPASAISAAPAQECLAAPKGQAPQGNHWFYRLDRATHRKCWYLGAQGARRHRPSLAHAVASARAAPRFDAAPAVASPAPAPQASARAVVAEAAFGARWPAQAPAAIEAAPRAEMDRVAATAAPTPAAPDRIAVRTVAITPESVARAPAPPKSPESALPPSPPPAPTATADERGGLPAALFGIALLLAVVGTILVRTRRRLLARSPDERRTPTPGHFVPGAATPHFRPPARAFMRATDADNSDIAAATLQLAIDPLPHAAGPRDEVPRGTGPGIAPAPDVEASLRQLLAAWERRAA